MDMSLRQRRAATAAAAAVLFVLVQLAPTTRASSSSIAVVCPSGERGSCKAVAADAPDALVRAAANITAYNATGFAELQVDVLATGSAALAAYAAGFAEGALLPELIWSTHVNIGPSNLTSGQLAFVKDNAAWMAAEITANPSDPYWQQVAQTLALRDGMAAGYGSKVSDPARALTVEDFTLLNLVTELGDIKQHTDPGTRPDFARMTPAELERYVLLHSHCSAMVRLTCDLSELYATHNTWTEYNAMVRVTKSFRFSTPDGPRHLFFTGYPGTVPGIDDFYTTDTMAVIETTNSVFNSALFDKLSPQTVPYWVRVWTALRLATDGPSWHRVFLSYNSGTYNNQWFTVDFALFEPHKPLPPNVLVVSEQIPGFHHTEDMTAVLQFGTWPSYNVPFFADIYSYSGYPGKPDSYTYQLAPRAQIFRRQAGAVETLEDVQHFMRFNNYTGGGAGGDPLAPTPTAAIAARGDLFSSDAGPFGAIDAKIVSSTLLQAGAIRLVAGPTTQNQPPFAWVEPFTSQVPHDGMPHVFDFDWMTRSRNGLGLWTD